jgi:hypothetical protein
MDADFCHLEKDCPRTVNLFLTDYHDLEIGLIFSNAFCKVLGELGSEEKLRNAAGGGRTDALRKILLAATAPLGALRWLNKSKSYSLKFDGINFSTFVDKSRLHVDTEAMCRAVCQGCRKDTLIKQAVIEVRGILGKGHDQKQLCCGHDMVEVMGIALRKFWGTQEACEVSEERLARSLRLAYKMEDFARTQLHEALRKWEKDHPNYRLFPT